EPGGMSAELSKQARNLHAREARFPRVFPPWDPGVFCLNRLSSRRRFTMGDSKDLVPLTRRGIPIARMRAVYRVDEVGRQLDKLPPKEHEGLRATYERMIEK